MADCPHCLVAQQDHLYALYRDGCLPCETRKMARSPLFFEAARSGKRFRAYREALAARGLQHDDVKAESMRLRGVVDG